MASNYAQGKSTDNERMPIVAVPSPVLTKKTWISENGVASSVITMHPNTTSLEVGAFGGQGVVLRWVPVTEQASVGAVWNASVISSGIALANFDHFVPAGTYRQFVVPKETQGTPLTVGAQIGSIAGLYQRVAWINKGATASSIIANEY